MSNHFAKFATAIVVAILATLAWSAVPRTANAADECLTEPTGPTSQGKHWYYHIERGTGRHCWYQRGQDDTAASGTAQDQSTTANDDASPATDQVVAARDQTPAAKPIAKPVAKKIETPATRSIADARAELPTKMRADDDSTAAPATAAASVASAAPSAPNATVWPNPQAALAAKPVAAEATPTTSSDTNAQQDTTASITPVPAAAPLPAPATQAGPLGNRHLGSLPMLLLVAFGALGLAGLTGSTVYRLATLRRRVRPEDRWTRNVTMPEPPARRPRTMPARPEPVQENGQNFQDYVQEPVEDEIEPEQVVREPVEHEPVVRAPVARKRFDLHVEVPRTEMGSADGNRRREQIEAHLAQLTRQLQADLEVHARAG